MGDQFMKQRSAAAKKSSKNQPDKLLALYLYLGRVQFLFIVLYLLVLLWVGNLEGDSAVGASLILGVVFWVLMPIFCILSLVTFVGVPLYILDYKPRARLLGWSLLAWATSLPLIYLGGKLIGIF